MLDTLSHCKIIDAPSLKEWLQTVSVLKMIGSYFVVLNIYSFLPCQTLCYNFASVSLCDGIYCSCCYNSYYSCYYYKFCLLYFLLLFFIFYSFIDLQYNCSLLYSAFILRR